MNNADRSTNTTENPEVLAKRWFIIAMVGMALYIGAIVTFITAMD